MNELFKKWSQAVVSFWNASSPVRKGLVGGGLALGLVALAGAGALARHDPMRILYTDLQPDESRAVVRKLGELKIPYQATDDGQTVSVPGSRVDAARIELAKDGIPGQDVVGFEKFDGSTLGMSSYVQRIQYVRAVQGELVRSIERLKSVKRARVHISLPPKKTFLEEEDPPKASVVLELARGQKPSKPEIQGIAHLVASAVEGLSVDQISIVDTRGDFLHRPGEDAASADKPTVLLEQQRTIEREYERRVEDILGPVVGPGKVRAKVTVELDPSRVNSTEETFDPDRTVVRSNIKNEENTNGSRPNPVGIPGSRSNLPGAEAQNPPVPMASTNSEKTTQNTNFAVPRKVTVLTKPSGSIKRLTVAVVVDGNYGKAADGKTETFQPRSQEELGRLRDLVANSIGFDDGRRDSLTITSMPFALSDLAPVAETPQGSPLSPRNNPLVKYGIFGLLAVLFLWFVVRPLLRWVFSRPEEPTLPLLPRTVAELESGVSASRVLALTEASAALEDSEPLEKKEEEDLRKRILDRLGSHPRKGFRIVQDWLEDSVPPEPAKTVA